MRFQTTSFAEFQHTAARRRLASVPPTIVSKTAVSTHSRPKAAGSPHSKSRWFCSVSTHSRPKAAGSCKWSKAILSGAFQHTAARRRLEQSLVNAIMAKLVSTHSRPKAAGSQDRDTIYDDSVSTHSRPKAAGDGLCVCGCGGIVSTHSRPKAAGPETDYRLGRLKGFNTQPPEGGWIHEEAVSVAVSVSTHSRPKAAGCRCSPD